MKGLSLFSGIGGLDLAAKAAGIEVTGMCEIAEYPREVLKRRFPNAKIVSDIHDVHGEDWRDSDIVFGGFPCQDLSFAGRRAGLSGMRSGLWYEMLRVVSEIRPYWVLAENVRGAVSLALDSVRTDLEDEGYVVWPFVVPAAAFGAPHRRERLFVVAARVDVADAVAERLKRGEWSEALCKSGPSAHEPVAECCARLWPTPRANDSEKRGDIAIDPRNGSPSAVKLWPTPHRNSSNGAGEHGDGGKNIQTAVNGTLNPDWVECLQGFPIGWTDIDCDEPEPWPGWPAGMGAEQFDYEPPRTCKNVPNRAKRLKALGNAVVPQQALPLLAAIVEIGGIIANHKKEEK